MSFNGVGFGHSDFGHFPFGHADLGEELVIRPFPDAYIVNSEDPTGKNQELLTYLNLIKDSVNRVKEAIDGVSDQIDFEKVQESLLAPLGRTIGVELDEVEPAEFRRSLVGGAILFYRIKGTLDSYKIRGKISGFDVDVFQLYKLDQAYVPLFPVDNVFNLPTGSEDYYTDLPPGTVDGTPTEVGCGYCLTSSVKMSFLVVKDQPPAVTGQANIFDRVVAKLRDIIPIHIRELLFEIVAIIMADEHQNMTIGISAAEDTFTPASCFKSFDVVPADCVALDTHGTVAGTTAEAPYP